MRHKSGQFYVYVYTRPDSSPFYVGKGTDSRSSCLSPSRRNAHFMNIVNKYGKANIAVEKILCANEKDAFSLEMDLIKEYRNKGFELANYTNGGEGASGRKLAEKSRKVFSEWQGCYHKLKDSSKQRILDGLERGREKTKEWLKTDAGIAHLKRLSDFGKINLHKERNCVCNECNACFVTRSAKARFCGRKCEQISRRRRQKINLTMLA